MQTGRPKIREDLELVPVQARTMTMTTPDGNMTRWMFKEESSREETKKRVAKKKPAQLEKNGNHGTQDVKVQESTTTRKCVAGPVLIKAQAKNDKIHLLKVKEAMSSVDKSAIEDLQNKDATLRKCFVAFALCCS